MQIYGDYLYILGAQNNNIQKISLSNCKELEKIELNTEGFSTNFNIIDDTNLAIVTDIKKNLFTIIDLEKGKILKTYVMNIPMKNIKAPYSVNYAF